MLILGQLAIAQAEPILDGKIEGNEPWTFIPLQRVKRRNDPPRGNIRGE